MARRAARTTTPGGPPLHWRLEFEHESRPYVWTGWASDGDQAERDARAELFADHPFTGRAAPRLVGLQRLDA